MADPPDDRAARPSTTLSTIKVPQLENAEAEGANTTNMDTVATRINAATVFNTDAAEIEDDSATATAGGDAAASNSVNNMAPTLMSNVTTQQCSTATLTSQQSVAASEEHAHAAECADNNPSLFAKLPGELRNRIYRTYFGDFLEQKKNILDIRKTTPTYLNLLHTDHMIRSEASSIFYEEHFCVDSFVACTKDLESALEFRIESICQLVALHNVHMPISITVQEMVPMQVKIERQMPFPWDDRDRCNFVNKLTRFIATRTREVFVCRTGPQQREHGGYYPFSHMVYVGSKAYVSSRYRVEHVDPDAALSPQQRHAQHQQ